MDTGLFLLADDQYEYELETEACSFEFRAGPPWPRTLTAPPVSDGLFLHQEAPGVLGNDPARRRFARGWPRLLAADGIGMVKAAAGGAFYRTVSVTGGLPLAPCFGPRGEAVLALIDDVTTWRWGSPSSVPVDELAARAREHYARLGLLDTREHRDVRDAAVVTSSFDDPPEVAGSFVGHCPLATRHLREAAVASALGGAAACLEARAPHALVDAWRGAAAGSVLASRLLAGASPFVGASPLVWASRSMASMLVHAAWWTLLEEDASADPWRPLVELMRHGLWPRGLRADGTFVVWAPQF